MPVELEYLPAGHSLTHELLPEDESENRPDSHLMHIRLFDTPELDISHVLDE